MISKLWRMVGAIWVIYLHFERTSVCAPCCYFSPSYWTPLGKSFRKQVWDWFKTNELIPERTSYPVPSQKPHMVSTPIQNRIDSTQDKNKNQGCNLTSIWLLQDIYWPLSCQPPCTCLVVADSCIFKRTWTSTHKDSVHFSEVKQDLLVILTKFLGLLYTSWSSNISISTPRGV